MAQAVLTPPLSAETEIARANRQWLKDAVLSLSFANLAFYRSWELILDPAYDFYADAVPKRLIAATMLSVALLAAITWLVVYGLRTTKSGIILHGLRLTALSAVLLLNPLASFLPAYLDGPTQGLGAIATIAIGLTLALISVIVPRHAAHFLGALLLIASPMVLVTYSQALYKMLGPTPAGLRNPVNLPVALSHPPQRVVWIIFDEMDEALAFARRPSSLQLPEFDRFRRQSWSAEHALPPADATLLSIPAMFEKTTVNFPKAKKGNDLELTFVDGRPSAWWSQQQTPFDVAHSVGANSAIVGWYHPYCRIFGARVSYCYNLGVSRPDHIGGCSDCAGNLLAAIGDRAVSVLAFHDRAMIDHRYRWERQKESIDIPIAIEKAKTVAADPRFGFVYIHLGIPHPPPIYSRTSGQVALSGGSYFDNLALADRALGEIRSAMEQSGVWNSTAIVICSDHWYRYNHHREFGMTTPEDIPPKSMYVPVLIHLPRQNTATNYETTFNTTAVVGEIVERLLRTPNATPQLISNWVDELRDRVRWDSIVHTCD